MSAFFTSVLPDGNIESQLAHLKEQERLKNVKQIFPWLEKIPVIDVIANTALFVAVGVEKLGNVINSRIFHKEVVPGVFSQVFAERRTWEHIRGFMPGVGFIQFCIEGIKQCFKDKEVIEVNLKDSGWLFNLSDVQEVPTLPIPSDAERSARAHVSATYETQPDRICDEVCITAGGGIVHLDGAGHDNALVARTEHPIIRAYAARFSTFMQEEYPQLIVGKTPSEALQIFVRRERELFRELNEQMKEITKKVYGTHPDADPQIYLDYGAEQEALRQQWKEVNIETFEALRSKLDDDRLTRMLHRQMGQSRAPSDIALKSQITDKQLEDETFMGGQFDGHLVRMYRALLNRDANTFLQDWQWMQGMTKRYNALAGHQSRTVNHLRSQFNAVPNDLVAECIDARPKIESGSAFGFTQPLPVGDGYVFFRNLSDVCLMVISPKGEAIELKEDRSIDPDSVSVQFIYENMLMHSTTQPQLGQNVGLVEGLHLLGPFPRGAILLSFSDGIGEFLTQAEIFTLFSQHYENPRALMDAFKHAIQNPASDSSSAPRLQASRLPARSFAPCKRHDPNNGECYDDVSFGMTYLAAVSERTAE